MTRLCLWRLKSLAHLGDRETPDKDDRGHVEEGERRERAKKHFGIRIPRAWFPNHYDSISSSSVNLTVPGLPQISRLILETKKEAFQD